MTALECLDEYNKQFRIIKNPSTSKKLQSSFASRDQIGSWHIKDAPKGVDFRVNGGGRGHKKSVLKVSKIMERVRGI